MNLFIRLTEFLSYNMHRFSKRVPSTFGLLVLDYTKKEIGKGETIGNNQGPDLTRYRGGKKLKTSWCAALIFAMMLKAAKHQNITLFMKRTHGARKLFRKAVQNGGLVQLPNIAPGDLVLWNRGSEGSWKAHIGIVSRVERGSDNKVSEFHYVAGNEGSFPSVVQEFAGINKPRRFGFARMA